MQDPIHQKGAKIIADHLNIAIICIAYIAFFFSMLALTPVGVYPIPDFQFSFGGITDANIGAMDISISWGLLMTFFIVTMLVVVVAINLLNTNIVGSGLNIDAKQLSTIVVGLIFSGMIGSTMQLMLTDVPFIIGIFLIWIPIGILCYSVIMDVGTK